MKSCIIIAGPTAVGKTALAINLASFFFTEIISADSRQCYKEMDIGVAKPSLEELSAVPHHFINSHSIIENISAATFESYALAAADKIFVRNNTAIVVGGTGLYIKAFCQGLDEIPAIEEKLRDEISANYALFGIEWLRDQVKNHDPQYYVKGEIQNPQRMMRALEVKIATGKSIMDFQSQEKKARPFNIIKIGLELPRPLLYERINERVDKMMAAGLLREVENLIPFKHLNALQTVGYRELFDYFDGIISLDRAVDLIRQNSRQYAKRQMTWFKKDPEMFWVDMQEPKKAIGIILKHAGITV